MKKLRFLSLFFCAIAALTFTSCLDDDDDNSGLSYDQIQQCYALTRGVYSGKVYYSQDPSSTNTTANDSADVRWSITNDSTMILQNVPAKALANGFASADVKAEFLKQANFDIPCGISYFRANPVQWLVNPQVITFNNFTYNGASHKLQIAFYTNNYYSFGLYVAANKAMQLQVIVGGAYIDGQYNQSIMPHPFGLTLIKR